jgi:hypothetical protein
MKLPARVKIGYADYAIRIESRTEAEEGGRNGLTLNEAQQIRINGAVRAQRQAEAVVHEMLHAIWCVFDVERLAAGDEEKTVTLLSDGLTTVMRDNPELFRCLQRALR